MTQTQLANAIGVGFQQLQKYETGANRVSCSRLWEISVALKVPVELFFDGASDAPSKESRLASDFLEKETHALLRAVMRMSPDRLEVFRRLVAAMSSSDEE